MAEVPPSGVVSEAIAKFLQKRITVVWWKALRFWREKKASGVEWSTRSLKFATAMRQSPKSFRGPASKEAANCLDCQWLFPRLIPRSAIVRSPVQESKVLASSSDVAALSSPLNSMEPRPLHHRSVWNSSRRLAKYCGCAKTNVPP